MDITKLHISVCQPEQYSDWDNYIKSHLEGTFFHLSGWKKIMEKSFSFNCPYLVAEANQKIVGLLPLVEVKSFLFGHSLTSLPFCVFGGALADTPEIKTALEKKACDIAEELGVDYLELRYKTEQKNDFLVKSVHSYFTTELNDGHDEILLSIKKKQRAVVRHSLKNELTVDVNKDINDFYHIYSTSVRNLGTPVFSKKYMQNILTEFPDCSDILAVSHNGKTISSVMNFYYKDQVLPYYGGGTVEARHLKSNDHMYYKLMCHAFDRGCKLFDFGRSKNDSGPYKYKKTWGMEPQPIFHYYHLVKATELPNLSPNNPKYALFIKLWQKLPLKVSQIIGPFLSKYLG